ncbi:MAG: chemotaxis protein CheD [Clostridiales bacterium]|nr:chemotaxis protein CheD [Clostridiales bacterium]MCF8021699.1 chemotaxis protein CheD [Clostridiales bacterium]
MDQAKLKEVHVGIADLGVVLRPDKLITMGLGSCVGVSLYDHVARVAGLLHLMLPYSTYFKNVDKKPKFADLGIPLLVDEMKKKGARLPCITAKLVGGAQMFSGNDEKLILNIGEKNVAAAREILKSMGIKIIAEEVGGNVGRTIILDSSDGKILIRTLGKKQMEI